MSLLESLTAITASNISPRLEFAYVDESGNTGLTAKGGTRTYTLGCALVPADSWTDRLDLIVEARRQIRDVYGVKMADELKANYLLRSRGPLSDLGLGDGQRRDMYRRLLTATSLVSSSVVAVVVDKEDTSRVKDPFDTAWKFLLQRLRIRSEVMGHPIVLVHDAGEDDRVRKVLRQFRRISYAPGGKRVEARGLIEDPVPRDSSSSYFIQSADLLAYAAFRRVQPPAARQASVCSQEMWGTVAGKWMIKASPRRGDGIVLYPS